MFGRFGSQIIAFIVSIYVIRELPVAAFGAFSILQSILAYILIFTSSGLQHIFQRYIPDLNANKQYGEINRVVIYGIGLRLLLGIIALILIYLLPVFWGN
ncbi:MAG: oligosaccharide flippase family protein [Chloroflexi bacterium]|nr:oligosaccharide flippase family protein [Chloroflexota bacterium]